METRNYVINTGDAGEVEFKTEPITGILDSFFLQSPINISMSIESELGYTLFNTKQINGDVYVAPRCRVVDKKYEMLNDNPMDKYFIAESLILKVIGNPNTEIKIILHFL